MDESTKLILEKQLDALNETIDMLIKHREKTIMDNINKFDPADIKLLTEPLDTHILACIDGIINITKDLKIPQRGGLVMG